MARTATAQEVRLHYKAMDYEVRISCDGRVEYRDPDRGWLEGRYVEEYRVEDDGRVHLT